MGVNNSRAGALVNSGGEMCVYCEQEGCSLCLISIRIPPWARRCLVDLSSEILYTMELKQNCCNSKSD